ncbi:MAG: hypothetical protein NTY34_06820, partial [Candidatus Omnitrophica bacterium]|nr:hypothetical protein [Candidatus Omnitrophota bacterium]
GKKVFVSASSDNTVRFFTLDPVDHTTNEVGIFDKHTNWVRSANETTLVVDGKKVFVSASYDKTVRFFTLDPVNHTTNEVAIFDKHTGWVLSANETTLVVDGKKVFVSASYDKTVRFFTLDPVNHTTNEVAMLRPRDGIKGHQDRCLSVAYIPGQKLLIASTGTEIDSSVSDKKKKFLNAVLFWDLSEAVTGQAPDTGGARAAARKIAPEEIEPLRHELASLEKERALLERLVEIEAGIARVAGQIARAIPAAVPGGVQDDAQRLVVAPSAGIATTKLCELSGEEAFNDARQTPFKDSSNLPIFVSASDDNTVKFFTLDIANKSTTLLTSFNEHTGRVWSAQYTGLKDSNNLPIFVSASSDNTVKFFTLDIANKSTTPLTSFNEHTGRVWSAQYTGLKDSNNLPIFVSASDDNTVKFFTLNARVKEKAARILPDDSAVIGLRTELARLEKERGVIEKGLAPVIAQESAAQVIPASRPSRRPSGKVRKNEGSSPSSSILPFAPLGKIGIEPILRNDTAMSVNLFCDQIPAILKEGRRYEVRYNSRVLDDSYKGLMEEYISILNGRFPSSEFKLVKSSFDDDRLLETKCYLKNGTSPIGEGAVRATPEEGELKEYFIRVVAMMNMTIAASSITTPGQNEDGRLIQYIASQYRSLAERGLDLTGDPAKDVDIVKNLSIILPKTGRINSDSQAVKNDMMRSLLRDA